MKIMAINCLVGVFHDAIKAIHREKHKAVMTPSDHGVLVERRMTDREQKAVVVTILVPWTNIVWAQMDHEPAAVQAVPQAKK